jgi:hypothetical protein
LPRAVGQPLQHLLAQGQCWASCQIARGKVIRLRYQV